MSRLTAVAADGLLDAAVRYGATGLLPYGFYLALGNPTDPSDLVTGVVSAVVVAAVLVGDWLSLPVAWELLAVSATVLVWHRGGDAVTPAFRYSSHEFEVVVHRSVALFRRPYVEEVYSHLGPAQMLVVQHERARAARRDGPVQRCVARAYTVSRPVPVSIRR